MIKSAVFGGQDDVIGPKWYKIVENFFFKYSPEYHEQILSWFYGVMTIYCCAKGRNLEKVARNVQKVLFLGQDDVIGPERRRIFEKICFKIIS